MVRKLVWFMVLTCFVVLLAALGVATWGYFYIKRDLPQLERIEDYRPDAVTRVLARDGSLIAEFYNERRYPVKISEIPLIVRQAFLAAEDAAFYSHPGIDFMSIFRAMIRNLQTGAMRQGGSTITQQVVKNMLLTPEKHIRRKIKEAVLSYQLEARFSKDEILQMYLNQIFFGNTAYGIRAAAKLYFRKELAELTVAEAAMLAGLPKAPSRYSPISNYDLAKRRQRYVIGQMVKAGFITPEVGQRAERESVKVYPASSENIYRSPYAAAEVRRLFQNNWGDRNIDIDGYEITTSIDPEADVIATRALQRGLRDVDKRRGWRGPLQTLKSASVEEFRQIFKASLPPDERSVQYDTVYPALVTGITPSGALMVSLGVVSGEVSLKAAGWAKKHIDPRDHVTWGAPEQQLRVGDVVEVSLPQQPTSGESVPPPPGIVRGLILDQTPILEGALVALDPARGEVVSMVGGYSYQRSQFNRVTQSLRQPGSSFKPILYLAAVDGFRYTPATIVHDAPRTFHVGDQEWTPGNYDETFLGDITLRMALEKSRNLVSVDIVSRIGLDAVIRYARLLGITSDLGQNLSLSLGSSEVSLFELTRAYGVFAAKGVLVPSQLISKIVDRDGVVVFDAAEERLKTSKQVIPESSAFIMSSMMKGVIERGTATRVKALGRPAAGKTGTSNDQMDTWFVGYTPKYVCGVWVGFDVKKEIGEKETGGAVSAPIWLSFMKEYLDRIEAKELETLRAEARAEADNLGIAYTEPSALPPLDFSVPDGVEPFWVDRFTGALTEPGSPNALYEYFLSGTEPRKPVVEEADTGAYLESPDL